MAAHPGEEVRPSLVDFNRSTQLGLFAPGLLWIAEAVGEDPAVVNQAARWSVALAVPQPSVLRFVVFFPGSGSKHLRSHGEDASG